MTRLVLPAFAKINLGLRVVGKRPDSYHELRTVYQTISLRDTLTFETAPSGSEARLEATGLPVPEGRENLVIEAALAFAHTVNAELGVRIHLRKRIPLGAGLGGGSSNAAVTLLALNRICGFPLGAEAVQGLAASLGSDVPFFLTGGTALGLGRGEIVRPLHDLAPCPVLLLVPDLTISTADAFRRADAILTPQRAQISIYRFSGQRVREVRDLPATPNDLERAVAPIHPRLGRLIKLLRSEGATVAAMTGSGSAVFGLFAGERQAQRAFKGLTGSSPVVRAWLGRTVGAAEYSAKLLFHKRKVRGQRKGHSDGHHAGQDLPGGGGKAQGVRLRHLR